MAIDLTRRHFVQATSLGVGAVLAHPVPLSATMPNTAIATTAFGQVRGMVEHGIHVFKGIRYGADTRPQRLMPPRPPIPWSGIQDAFEYGPSAPQRGRSMGSEDCLFLNIWTPGLRDGGKRPVLVYLHGGAFNTGSGSDPLYDGTQLCQRGDVVVITVNHRLNALGYLYLGDMDSRYRHSGNVGQLDLILMLRWVAEHAAEFGGDAKNVTLFGQSGGGAKIATLMAMPAARGLFHRAWTMSGQQVTAAGPRAADGRARLYLDALNIHPDNLDALQQLPLEHLLAALSVRDPSRVETSTLYLGPVMDGDTLPRHPFWPDAPPQSAQIPLVIGNTRDESRAFNGRDQDNFSLTWEEVPGKLRLQQYVDIPPETVVAEYRRLYPHYTPSEVLFAATTAGRSWRGALEELEARARQDPQTPTWTYQLDWYPRDTADGERLRAFHTLDIPLVFDNLHQPGARTGSSAEAQAVAGMMSQALLAFARHGNPNHARLPSWDRYTLAQRQTMVFDVPSQQVNDPRGGERQLYARVPYIQRGTM